MTVFLMRRKRAVALAVRAQLHEAKMSANSIQSPKLA